MIRADSAYETCEGLFARYPSASRHVSQGGDVRAMVLMVRNGDDASFYVLSRHRGDGLARYSISQWPAGDSVAIEAAGRPATELAVSALTRGLPLPRHGSIFGWLGSETVTAMVVCYTDYESYRPQPLCSVMPFERTAERQWPPFTDEPFLGHWFWEYCWAGRLVSLHQLIAATPETVFWVNTQEILGSDCCAVVRDVVGPRGRTLLRGRYVYSEVLREGVPVPSLHALLADPGRSDLAPRFARLAAEDAEPPGKS